MGSRCIVCGHEFQIGEIFNESTHKGMEYQFCNIPKCMDIIEEYQRACSGILSSMIIAAKVTIGVFESRHEPTTVSDMFIFKAGIEAMKADNHAEYVEALNAIEE